MTIETATSWLAAQGGRLAVLSPEGGIFATIAGRYSGTPNLEVFLKGHAGDMLRVGRQSRDTEHIDKPALTMGLAVQPEILRDIAGMPGFRGLGLLARILFALPEKYGRPPQDRGRPDPDERCCGLPGQASRPGPTLAEWTDPAVLVLTPDANSLVLDIERAVEPRLAPGGAWAHIVDWGSKYTGAVVRIAGLIHLAEHLRDGWGQPVSADTLERAAMIADYYAAHALAAFDDMGADQSTRNARTILAWIERTARPRSPNVRCSVRSNPPNCPPPPTSTRRCPCSKHTATSARLTRPHPYQLRHAAVSLWLNAGVPALQVAEWAGHSVHVLLKVYA